MYVSYYYQQKRIRIEKKSILTYINEYKYTNEYKYEYLYDFINIFMNLLLLLLLLILIYMQLEMKTAIPHLRLCKTICQKPKYKSLCSYTTYMVWYMYRLCRKACGETLARCRFHRFHRSMSTAITVVV